MASILPFTMQDMTLLFDRAAVSRVGLYLAIHADNAHGHHTALVMHCEGGLGYATERNCSRL